MKPPYYYYASLDFKRFDEPQSDALCDHQITEPMIKKAFEDCASGRPPFDIMVPPQVAYRLADWDLPRGLFQMCIIPDRADCHPFDVITIRCGDRDVHIYGRRCVPCDYAADVLDNMATAAIKEVR